MGLKLDPDFITALKPQEEEEKSKKKKKQKQK